MSRMDYQKKRGRYVRFAVLFLLSLLILNAFGAILKLDIIPQTVKALDSDGARIFQDPAYPYNYFVNSPEAGYMWYWDSRWPGISYGDNPGGGEVVLLDRPGHNLKSETDGFSFNYWEYEAFTGSFSWTRVKSQDETPTQTILINTHDFSLVEFVWDDSWMKHTFYYGFWADRPYVWVYIERTTKQDMHVMNSQTCNMLSSTFTEAYWTDYTGQVVNWQYTGSDYKFAEPMFSALDTGQMHRYPFMALYSPSFGATVGFIYLDSTSNIRKDTHLWGFENYIDSNSGYMEVQVDWGGETDGGSRFWAQGTTMGLEYLVFMKSGAPDSAGSVVDYSQSLYNDAVNAEADADSGMYSAVNHRFENYANANFPVGLCGHNIYTASCIGSQPRTYYIPYMDQLPLTAYSDLPYTYYHVPLYSKWNLRYSTSSSVELDNQAVRETANKVTKVADPESVIGMIGWDKGARAYARSYVQAFKDSDKLLFYGNVTLDVTTSILNSSFILYFNNGAYAVKISDTEYDIRFTDPLYGLSGLYVKVDQGTVVQYADRLELRLFSFSTPQSMPAGTHYDYSFTLWGHQGAATSMTDFFTKQPLTYKRLFQNYALDTSDDSAFGFESLKGYVLMDSSYAPNQLTSHLMSLKDGTKTVGIFIKDRGAPAWVHVNGASVDFTYDSSTRIVSFSTSFSGVGQVALGWGPLVQWSLTVTSAHSSPVPSVGTHSYNDGSSVTASVPTPVTEGGYTYWCTGWTGTGSVPASGSTSTVTFTITADSSITWAWSSAPVQYTITVTQGAGGTIVPGTTVVAYGATPSFTVMPSTGYYTVDVLVDGFSVLSQVVNGVYTFPAVSADHTITASFAVYTSTGASYKISINGQQHNDYGLGYPVTYVFGIPAGSGGLKAYVRHSVVESWSQLTEKTSSDFFDGIECVRFDYAGNKAYISVAFSGASNDIYVRLTAADGNLVQASYVGIAEYYDNRKAAVVATADDWDGYSDRNDNFVAACDAFQSRSMWLTVGITTEGLHGEYPPTPIPVVWANVQAQINGGYVEIASHSSTHDEPPYADYDFEIGDSKADIIGNLILPSVYTMGNSEFVWAWLEPGGLSDSTVRQKLGVYKYLVDRSYYDRGIIGWTGWDAANGLFDRIGITIEMGNENAQYQTHNVAVLNGWFDTAYAAGGIYHLMMHPQNVNWASGSYAFQHLDYIKGKLDVWYVGFGAAYAYHYVATVADISVEPCFTITVTHSPGGSIVPDTTTVDAGSTPSFTITPDGGYHIADVKVDGVSVLAQLVNGVYTFPAVTASHTIDAEFAPDNAHVLTVNVVGSGSVTKSPDQAAYHYGDVVQLSATPVAGWSFSGWSGDLSGNANPGSITMSGDKSVTATFTQNEYTLTVTVAPSSVAGSVSADIPGPYHLNDVVNLTPTANPGYTFSGWTGDGVNGAGNTRLVTMDSAKSVTATFIQNQYTLTVNVVGSGSVAKSPDQATYHYGDVVQLSATPVAGWSFTSWSGDASGWINPVSVTIDGNKAVTATFTESAYTLTVSTVGSGSVTRSPDQATYASGSVVTLTTTPAAGWSFSSWSGDLTGNANPASITINGNKAVTATFTQNEYTLTVTTVGSGSVAKSPDQVTYHYGDSVQLTATPSAGWSFSGWTGDLTGSANPASLTITDDMSVTATFTEDQYTLTVNVVGTGCSVTKSPDQATYTYGASVELSPVAAPGWTFSGWSGDLTGTAVPGVISMTGSRSVTATFTQNEIPFAPSVVGSGSVAKVPDQATYHLGDSVQLTANPVAGWTFSGWTGDLTGLTNPAILVIDSDPTVTATFIQNQYTLTVNVVGSGSVAKSPDQATYHYGDVVQLSATPVAGWSFTSWSGDLTGNANPASITINGNKAVTATFTLSSDFSISVKPASRSIAAGSAATFTVTASLLYGTSDSVSFSCSGLPSDATASFSPDSGLPTFSSTLKISTLTSTPAGLYTITVTGSSSHGSHSATLQLKIMSFSVGPTPFSPNGDGVKDTTTVDSTFWDSLTWTLTVKDATGVVVRQLGTGIGSSLSVIWDGKNDAGAMVGDGTYTVTLSLPGLTKTGKVVVDTVIPTVICSWSRSPFDPRSGQTSRLRYTLSEKCTVYIQIFDGADNLVRTLLAPTIKNKGTSSLLWDGMDDSGVIVPSGTYTCKIFATDLAGNQATTYPTTSQIVVS